MLRKRISDGSSVLGQIPTQKKIQRLPQKIGSFYWSRHSSYQTNERANLVTQSKPTVKKIIIVNGTNKQN